MGDLPSMLAEAEYATVSEFDAAAFAGFVRTPPGVDANSMLRLAGFGLDAPHPGRALADMRLGNEVHRWRPQEAGHEHV